MAKDIYHQAVRTALEKDGWKITNDPYLIPRKNRKAYEVDLGVEKFLAAERGTERIAIEIKSFLRSSMAYDFHAAFGQYGIYRFFMTEKDPERKLFLAITEEVFLSFFSDEEVKAICQHFQVSLIVFDSTLNKIVQWLPK